MTVVFVPSLRYYLLLFISIFPLLPKEKVQETKKRFGKAKGKKKMLS